MIGRIILLLLLFSSPAFAWEGVVIHHTASEKMTKDDCNEWHRQRGWDECGYNFIVSKDGSIEKGRGTDRPGAHALNPRPSRNRTHIGVAIVGNDDFNKAQYKSLRNLLRELNDRFGSLAVENHHENCPGTGFQWPLLTYNER